jgi:prolyl-tRNA synthetase
LLEEIQQGLFKRAVDFRTEHTSRAENWDEFLAAMEGRPGFVIARWCGDAECEARIKVETQATIRNLPFEQVAAGMCARCDKPAITEARFAKAY